MNDFNNPASCFEAVLYRNFFFSTRTDVRFVAVYLHNFLRFFTRVSCICTKILLRPATRLSNSILQHGFYLSDIMLICAGYGDRQRDSILVYENMTLGCIFFPDLWDWLLPIPVLWRLLLYWRQYFSISMLSLPNYHIVQDLFSRVSEKTFCRPFLKIAINAAGTAVFSGERLPLNSRSQDINDGFKNLSRIHCFSAVSFPTLICFGFITFRFRNE